jgi:hypothetical protein
MNHSVKLSDKELLEIAKSSIRNYFSEDELTGVEFQLERRDSRALALGMEAAEPETVAVLMIHPEFKTLPSSSATSSANTEMWQKIAARHDDRIFLLFHRYPEGSQNSKSAA